MNPTTRRYLSDKYWLHYVDYRDSVEPEMLAECLETKDASPIWDALAGGEGYALAEEMRGIAGRMAADGHGDIFDEDEDEIREWICDHDCSDPVKDLCRNTTVRARVVQRSNSECWTPPYYGGAIEYEGAFREAVDMLGLNPKDVKRELLTWADCTGRWPDRPRRKPVVDVKDFSRCCRNLPGSGAWGFFGTVKGSLLHGNGFRIGRDSVIPKGTTCGWCDWWNGGGTLELIETVRDVSLGELDRSIARADRHSDAVFEIDEKGACSGYSIMSEVYGATYEGELLRA